MGMSNLAEPYLNSLGYDFQRSGSLGSTSTSASTSDGSTSGGLSLAARASNKTLRHWKRKLFNLKIIELQTKEKQPSGGITSAPMIAWVSRFVRLGQSSTVPDLLITMSTKFEWIWVITCDWAITWFGFFLLQLVQDCPARTEPVTNMVPYDSSEFSFSLLKR